MFKLKKLINLIIFLVLGWVYSFANQDVSVLKVSPCFFIPNRVEGKKILKNEETIAFIQTMKGKVQFSSDGVYIGILVPKDNSKVKRKEKVILNPMHYKDTVMLEARKLVIMGLGFVDRKTKSRKSVRPFLEEEMEGKVNFFIGDKSNWRTNIPTYKKLVYPEVWKGIDVEYVGYMDKLEYRLIVKPYADTSSIVMSTGGESLRITEKGALRVEVAGASILLSKPIAYQVIDGKRKEISVRYRILENGNYAFELGEYDNSKTLIIDPYIDWSTYLGRGNEYNFVIDVGKSIKIDNSGNVYITGYTQSFNFPTTSGVYDESYNDDDNGYSIGDAFITKLSPNGSSLIYSTFLGGERYDNGYSIAIDEFGNVYVTGVTQSSNFPTTDGAYDRDFNGYYDIFIAKLSPNGSNLLYSTLLGGSEEDRAEAITIDGSGNAYITGYTQSSDFPTTSGAFDESYHRSGDVFVLKLNPDGSSLIYSTIIGGLGDDIAFGIAVNSSGNAYIAGSTRSSDFPTTSEAFDKSYNGNYDVFVAELSADGSSLIYSTFIGGFGDEKARDITINSSGNAYITGYHMSDYSDDFPITESVFSECYDNYGSYEVFVTKLSTDGSSLIYSTMLGGDLEDYGSCIAIDESENVYVVGYTFSEDFPTTAGALNNENLGNFDIFIFKLNKDASSLIYSTYLGGDGDDYPQDIVLDTSGNVYVTGTTFSDDFPITGGAYDESLYDVYKGDIFITKLSLSTNMPLPFINTQNKSLITIKKIDTTIVNPYNQEVSVDFLYYDEAGSVIKTERKAIPAYGKIIFNPSENFQFNDVKIFSDYKLIVYSNIESENGKMSAYLDSNLFNRVYIPHIAESTDWWDTNVFLMSNILGNIQVIIPTSITKYYIAVSKCLTVIDMEYYLSEDLFLQAYWGLITSDATDVNTMGKLFSGFEVFVHNGTDGAAVELQNAPHRTLYVPHVPEETDIFWTGFAFVNPNNFDTKLKINFYTSDGENLGSAILIIPAMNKISGLMKDFFADYFGKAEWAIIKSGGPIIGIEIYGTQKDGICGYSLPHNAYETGILPEIINGEKLWSGFALTNVSENEAHVRIQLIDKNGNVKAEKEENILSKHRFKAVVSDYFEGVELEDGDYIRYSSDNPLIGIIVNGDLDRTFMTALTSTN